MISREMFLEALKQMADASAVIEAYQMQFSKDVEPKNKYKEKHLLITGDQVECVEVHGNSKGTLTVGKKYPVKRINDTRWGLAFYIENDNNKLKRYQDKNTQFKALN